MATETQSILIRCEEVAKDLKKKGYNVFYVGLYGSQNYNLHTEKSDYDFKALIIPSLEDLVKNSKPISKVYDYDWGQVEAKDIRNYIDSAVKVNINFLEILSTKYFWASDYDLAGEMRAFFVPLVKNQWCQYIRAAYWMMEQKFHALRHEYPTKVDVLAKYGYDPKQLCHIRRLSWEIEKYCLGETPDFIVKWDERRILMEIKEWHVDDTIVDEYVEQIFSHTREIVDSYIESHTDTFETKKKVIDFSNNLIINNIKSLWVTK